jgi:hypothetical protein
VDGGQRLQAAAPPLQSIFGSDWIRTEALNSCFDAFSSREPVSTSLENAMAVRGGLPFPAAPAAKNPAVDRIESALESRFSGASESTFGDLEKA